MISLVTGANRGIGLEVCRQLAALGHTVLLTARSPDAATAAADGLGPTVHPLRLDVTSDDDGRTWSVPRPTPFYGDRPSIGLLQSGRLLVTYRNVEPAPHEAKLKVGLHPGTWAWLGDLSGLQGSGGESRFLEIEHDGCGWHGVKLAPRWRIFLPPSIPSLAGVGRFCPPDHRSPAPTSRSTHRSFGPTLKRLPHTPWQPEIKPGLKDLSRPWS